MCHVINALVCRPPAFKDDLWVPQHASVNGRQQCLLEFFPSHIPHQFPTAHLHKGSDDVKLGVSGGGCRHTRGGGCRHVGCVRDSVMGCVCV